MSARIAPEEAARLRQAERRWLAQCAARLQRSGAPQRRSRTAVTSKDGGRA